MKYVYRLKKSRKKGINLLIIISTFCVVMFRCRLRDITSNARGKRIFNYKLDQADVNSPMRVRVVIINFG